MQLVKRITDFYLFHPKQRKSSYPHMQCDRLIKQIKSWYTHVKDETMAPARMVSFIEQHINSCDTCLADPELKAEVAKITELVLPESKIPKAVRQQNSKLTAEDEEHDDEEVVDEVVDDDEVESTSDDLDDEEEEEDLNIQDTPPVV
ncbi:MAG: hypothetical protein ACI8ZB_003929 [Desulforhopalus sp.]|jgi:hypothetical protein